MALPRGPPLEARSEPEGPQPPQTHESNDQRGGLERLPPELRRSILLTLDFNELKGLVHASPVFHAQYHEEREHFIYALLSALLGPSTADAFIVLKCNSASFLRDRTKEKVDEVVDQYLDNVNSFSYSDLRDVVTIDEAISMAKFHRFTIKPLLRHYVSWALDLLAEKTHSPQSIDTLSTTEESRVTSAMYRFQLFCNLYGAGGLKEIRPPSLGMDEDTETGPFVRLFEPWEVDGICCIYQFVKEMLACTCDRFDWDFDQDLSDSDDDWSLPPELPVEFSEAFACPDPFLHGMVSRGLESLYTVLFKVKDRPQLIHEVQGNQRAIQWMSGNTITESTLSAAVQLDNRLTAESHRDQLESNRVFFPFNGDVVADRNKPLSLTDYPPLAWTLIWGNRYSNFWGIFVPTTLHRWGYLFWDAERIRGSGAEQLIAREWNDHHEGADPRDHLQLLDSQ